LQGTKIFFVSDTHGIISKSVWNSVPFFHILNTGCLAPCLAHDLHGGIFKTDISNILTELSRKHLMTWSETQAGLLELQTLLRFEDKYDLSTR
jgi:hypothetical protein